MKRLGQTATKSRVDLTKLQRLCKELVKDEATRTDLVSRLQAAPPETSGRYVHFLSGAGRFGKKFVQGKVRLTDYVRHLKSVPPDLRSRLAQRSGCEILKPGVYEEQLALLEQVIEATEGLRTPENSQLAALLGIFYKHVFQQKNFQVGLPTFLAQLPTAWFNIEKHIKTAMPLLPESLRTHDQHLFGMLRISRSSRDLSPVWSERRDIAAQREDGAFQRRFTRAFRKRPDLHHETLFEDLGVTRLRRILLARWIELFPGCQPNVGLCDFTYQAIVEFCCVLYSATDDKEFNLSSVRDAIRRPPLKLVRRRSTVTAIKFDLNTQRVLLTVNGQKVMLLKP